MSTSPPHKILTPAITAVALHSCEVHLKIYTATNRPTSTQRCQSHVPTPVIGTQSFPLWLNNSWFMSCQFAAECLAWKWGEKIGVLYGLRLRINRSHHCDTWKWVWFKSRLVFFLNCSVEGEQWKWVTYRANVLMAWRWHDWKSCPCMTTVSRKNIISQQYLQYIAPFTERNLTCWTPKV